MNSVHRETMSLSPASDDAHRALDQYLDEAHLAQEFSHMAGLDPREAMMNASALSSRSVSPLGSRNSMVLSHASVSERQGTSSSASVQSSRSSAHVHGEEEEEEEGAPNDDAASIGSNISGGDMPELDIEALIDDADDSSMSDGDEFGLNTEEDFEAAFDSEAVLQDALHGFGHVPRSSKRHVKHVERHLAAVHSKLAGPFSDGISEAIQILDLDPGILFQESCFKRAESRNKTLEVTVTQLVTFLEKHDALYLFNPVKPSFTNEALCSMLIEQFRRASAVLRHRVGMQLAHEGRGPSEQQQEQGNGRRGNRGQDREPDPIVQVPQRPVDPDLQWGDREVFAEDAEQEAQLRRLHRQEDDREQYRQRHEPEEVQGNNNLPWETAAGGNLHPMFIPFKGSKPVMEIITNALRYLAKHDFKRCEDSIVKQRKVHYKGKTYPTRMWEPWQLQEEDFDQFQRSFRGTSRTLARPIQPTDDALHDMLPEEPEEDAAPEQGQRKRRAKKAKPKRKPAASMEQANMEQAFQTLVFMVFDKERHPQMWSRVMKGRILMQVSTYLRKCCDYEFETVKPCRAYKSFQNGTYDCRKKRFYHYDDPDYPAGVVACRFMSRPYNWEFLKGFNESNWHTIPTPVWDGIFRAQYSEESEEDIRNVTAMSHLLHGRLDSDPGSDNLQVSPMFLTAAKSRSELIRYAAFSRFDRRFIGRLSNNAEKRFGLQPAKGKLLVTVVNGNRNFAISQSDIQSIQSDEPVSVAEKNKVAITTVLGRFIGFFVEFMKFQDAQGSQERRNVWFLFRKALSPRLLQLFTKEAMAQELDALLHKQALAYSAGMRLFAHRDLWGTVTLPDTGIKVPIMPRPLLNAAKNMKIHNHPLNYALKAIDNGLIVPELPLENGYRKRLIQKYSLRMPFSRFQEVAKQIWLDNQYWGNNKVIQFTFTRENYQHSLNSAGIQTVELPAGTIYNGERVNRPVTWVEGVTEALTLTPEEVAAYEEELDRIRNNGSTTLELVQSYHFAELQRQAELMRAAREAPSEEEEVKSQEVAGQFEQLANLPNMPLAPKKRESWGFRSNLHGLLQLSYDRLSIPIEQVEAILYEAYESMMRLAPRSSDTEMLAKQYWDWAIHIMDLADGFLDNQTVLFHRDCIHYGLELLYFHLRENKCLEHQNRHARGTNQFYMTQIMTLSHCACFMLSESFNCRMASRGFSNDSSIEQVLATRWFQLLYVPTDRTTALTVHLLQICDTFNFCRQGLDVVRPILSPPLGAEKQRYYTCAWERVCSVEEFIMLSTPKFSMAQQWCNLLEERANVLRYLIRGMDAQFKEIQPSKRYYSFSDGLYDVVDCEFYAYDDPEFPQDIVSFNYFDQPMCWDEIKDLDFRDNAPPSIDPITGEAVEAGAFYIEAYDSILDHQLQGVASAEERSYIKSVIDALHGRTFHDVNTYDNWKNTVLHEGCAGSGKSTLLNLQTKFHPVHKRGYISNACEDRFGLEPLIGKSIAVCPEVRWDWNIDPSQFLLSLHGEFMIVMRKGLNGHPMTWTAPWLLAGNAVANFMKDSSELINSIIVVPYAYPVPKDMVNPEFPRRLEEARPRILVRQTKGYRYFTQRFGNCGSIWKPHTYMDPDTHELKTETFMPKFLRDANRRLNMYTHPLAQAMNTVDNGLFVLGTCDNEEYAKSLIASHHLRMPLSVFREEIEKIIAANNIRRGHFRWRLDDMLAVLQEYGVWIEKGLTNIVYGGELKTAPDDYVCGITLQQYMSADIVDELRHAILNPPALTEHHELQLAHDAGEEEEDVDVDMNAGQS